MKYKLVGNTMPAVEITFERSGESMFTESGSMCWMSEGVSMDTNMRGGFGKSLGRMFGGESLFMATYTATYEGDYVAFASSFAGEIIPVTVNGNRLICQKNAFLCAENSVELNTTFTKKLGAGFFAGEGFILQELSGRGTAFLEVAGNLIEKDLEPGEVLKVDTGNVVAFDSTVDYDIETVKGFKNVLMGGEGLFLTRLQGPGKVYLQSSNISDLVNMIASRIPSK